MTGWFIAFGLAALAFLALLLLGRIPRAAREISAAALRWRATGCSSAPLRSARGLA